MDVPLKSFSETHFRVLRYVYLLGKAKQKFPAFQVKALTEQAQTRHCC